MNTRNFLVRDLRVREQKHDALALLAGAAVHLLQVLAEAVHVVRAADDDHVGRVAADVRREAAQRLLARAPDADEQRVAAGVGDDAADAAHVLHGVLKQHQVHGGVGLVVLLERLHERLVQRVVVLDLVVDLVAEALRESGRR